VGVVAISTISLTGLGVGSASSSAAQAVAGVTKNTVTIGVSTPETGALAQEWGYGLAAMKAEFAYQNAHGGVNGRKIKIVVEDDQGSNATQLTAAESLVQVKHVFGMINFSPAVGDQAFLSQNGVPVVSNSVQHLYSNIFTIVGNVDPNSNDFSTTIGKIFKKIGAKKVGTLALNVEAQVIAAGQNGVTSSVDAGLQAGYSAYVPFGVTDWTPYVLGFQTSDTDGFWPQLDAASAIGFMTTAAQQGLKLKSVFVNGYATNPYLIKPLVSVDQGTTVLSYFAPIELHSKAAENEAAVLKKYGHINSTDNAFTTWGYVAALLEIQGLQGAGKALTRQGFISHLARVTNWTADGLEAAPVNFETTNTVLEEGSNNCDWILQIKGSKYVPVGTKPICGTLQYSQPTSTTTTTVAP